MDKFETLAAEASIAAAILANANVTDIELLPIRPRSLTDGRIHDLARLWAFRGLRFIGVAGIVNDMPYTALALRLDPERISALSEAFAAYSKTVLSGENETPRAIGDEVEWLRKLWSLTDARE
jgi:hypothetical protein